MLQQYDKISFPLFTPYHRKQKEVLKKCFNPIKNGKKVL